MFKNSIIIAFSVFIFLIIKQLIFNSQVNWNDNIGIFIAIFLIYLFLEWVKKPYDWNKSKKEN